MMRILMACAAFPPVFDGAGAASTLALARALQRAGHAIQVVHVGDDAGDGVHDDIAVRELASLNLYWQEQPPRPAWQKLIWHGLENFNPRAYWAMQREIKSFAPDMVLTDGIENINVATWAAAKKRRLPVCHILRNAFLMCVKSSMMRAERPCAGICTGCKAGSFGKKWASRLVDAVVGEAGFIVDQHVAEGYFPKAAAQVIPGSIEAIRATAPRLTPRGRPLRIGYIGALTRLAGLDTLAAAAQHFASRPGAEFFIAGDGRAVGAQLVADRFPSARTRQLRAMAPAEFFPQIDVLVVPSLATAPFATEAIEAFSYGVPVLAARAGGIAEVIDPGRNGFSFPPGDAPALIRLIQDLIDRPQALATLSAGALRSARRYLSDGIADEYSSLFAILHDQNAATA